MSIAIRMPVLDVMTHAKLEGYREFSRRPVQAIPACDELCPLQDPSPLAPKKKGSKAMNTYANADLMQSACTAADRGKFANIRNKPFRLRGRSLLTSRYLES